MGAGTRENKYSEANVSLRLRPSRIALAFIAAGSLATLAMLALLPGSSLARAGAAAWCAAIAWHAFGHALKPRELVVSGGLAVAVDGAEGRIVEGSFVAPWLTVVHWRPLGARFARTVLVLPDMVDAESFRRLRVILRWCPR